MNNGQRALLDKGQAIRLCAAPGEGAPEEFIIRSVAGESSACVCYEVTCADGTVGILKEFYPAAAAGGNWYYTLTRREDGQLLPADGAYSKFHEMCREQVQIHETLCALAQHARNGFLQAQTEGTRVLYGTADNASVYCLFSRDVGERFDRYLSSVRQEPEQDASETLLRILRAVHTVTEGLQLLHEKELLLPDLCPGSFAVVFGEGKPWLCNLSTLYSAKGEIPRTAGTEGCRAPEIFLGKADCRSDIYAIGAMLFHGLVVLEDVPDGLYRDSYHEKLDSMVKHSRLIQSAGIGIKTGMLLGSILKNCLNPDPDSRYNCCQTLASELLAVIRVLENVPVRRKKSSGTKAKTALTSPAMVMQKALYDYPLYTALKPGQKDIRVLVLGGEVYGKKFMDLCLQAGQMKDHTVHITCVSYTPEADREAYLRARPALSRFVNVDGSMAEDPRAYGSLTFLSPKDACGYTGKGKLRFERGGNLPGNSSLAAMLIRNASYDYIFISLGSSDLNQQVATLCETEVRYADQSSRCPICYVSELSGRKAKREANSLLRAVHIHDPITPQTISPLLEQMAFNADLAWNSSLNMDIRAAFEAFKADGYRYSSSLAYALSIPYKLFSIGTVIQNPNRPFAPEQFPDAQLVADPTEAADAFAAAVLSARGTDPEAEKKFRTLIWLEHRRWVLSLVCEGWDVPTDENGQLSLTGCVTRRSVKNKAEKTHPCIVFSTEDSPLSSAAYTENGHQKWDDPTADKDLDALDRVSVQLYRLFRRQADSFRKSNPLQTGDIPIIEALIASAGDRVEKAFQQYLFCLKNILNGVESYSRQYDYYAQAFANTLDAVDPETKEAVETRLALVRQAFFPVNEANLHRNYKAIDEALVEKLPFILTYRYRDTLALAFEDGREQNGCNDAIFANVASATVLCPESILYLYHCTVDASPTLLKDKLSAVLNYLGKRKVRCRVRLTMTFAPDVPAEKRESLKNALETLSAHTANNAVFDGFSVLEDTDAVSAFLQYMKTAGVRLYDGSTRLFPSALDNAAFISRLVKAKLPYFEFDRKRKLFTELQGCHYLQYIRDHASIRINDMFALMNAGDTRFNLPEFADDYTRLWKIYTGADVPGYQFNLSVANWNNLCNLLENHDKNQNTIITFPLLPTSNSPVTTEFVLPQFAYRKTAAVIDKLIRFKIIAPDSHVEGYTSETCRAVILADPSHTARLNRLFARHDILHDFYDLQVEKRLTYTGEAVHVLYCNLTVEKANLDPEGKDKGKYLLNILNRLEKGKFIHSLRQDSENPNIVSFAYTSPRLKKLLTTAGEILEIYTYYQVLETGYFDDVACGYEFHWQDGEVRNELDLVATKGFRSMIVECKAVQKLDLDYYHKLHSIAGHFGIGAKKVLVGNTYSVRPNDPVNNASNTLQTTRGNQLGIITVSEESKIKNIGETLMKIMEA